MNKKFPALFTAMLVWFFLLSCIHAGEKNPNGNAGDYSAWAKAAVRSSRSLATRKRIAALLAWNSRSIVHAYLQSGRKSPKWDTSAKEALTLLVRLWSNDPKRVDPADVAAAMGKVVNAGCDDPMILYGYACILTEQGNKHKVIPFFQSAAKGFEESAYPAYRRITGFEQDLQQHVNSGDWDLRERGILQKVNKRFKGIMDLIPAMARDKDLPERLIVDLFSRMITIRLRMGGDTENRQDAFDKIFPTFQAAYRGRKVLSYCRASFLIYQIAEIDAGNSKAKVLRGNRYKEVEKILVAAWRKDSSDPLPCLLMFAACTEMGMSRSVAEKWFGRAAALGALKYENCRRMLKFLHQNQNGGAARMLEFGRECLETKLWPQDIPFVLVDAHLMLKDVYARKHGAFRPYFRQPAVWKDLSSVYEPYLKKFPDAKRALCWYAKLACWSGRWKQANDLFERIGDQPELHVFGSMAAYQEMRVEAAKQAGSNSATTKSADPKKAGGGSVPIAGKKYPILSLPWRATFEKTEDLGEWEVIDRRPLKGDWKIDSGVLRQASNTNGDRNKISTAFILKSAVKPPCALRFSVLPKDNDMFGVLIAFRDIDNTHQVIFNSDYGPFTSAGCIRNGKKGNSLKRPGGYKPGKKQEIEVRWSDRNVLVLMDDREVVTLHGYGHTAPNGYGRIGFFCNGMEGVTFSNVRLESIEGEEAKARTSAARKEGAKTAPDGENYIQALKKAFADPPRAKMPTLFLFPLVDENGKRTAVGNLVSRAAMSRAANAPLSVMHYPIFYQWLANNAHLHRVGLKIPKSVLKSIPAMMGTKESWTGTLVMEDGMNGGKYKAEISAVNPAPDRPFRTKSFTGSNSDIHLLPQKIASAMHAYLGIKATPKIKNYLAVPDYDNAKNFRKAAEIVAGSIPQPARRGSALRSLVGNKGKSIFAYLLAYSAFEERDNQLLTNVGSDAHSLDSKLFKLMRVDTKWLHNEAMERILFRTNTRRILRNEMEYCLALIGDDPYNHRLYNKLLGWAIENRSVAAWDLICRRWASVEPNSPSYHYWLGAAYRQRAWAIRGGGWASTVSKDEWKSFGANRKQAEKHLLRSVELNPDGARAPSLLVDIFGSGGPKEDFEKYFRVAVANNPFWKKSYRKRAWYLMPRWGGSHEAMLELARECLKHKDLEGGVPFEIYYIVRKIAMDRDFDKDGFALILKHPDVREMTKELYARAKMSGMHLSPYRHSIFAVIAALNKDWETAATEFRAFGNPQNTRAFVPKIKFEELRRRTFAQLPKKPKEPKKEKKKNPSKPKKSQPPAEEDLF